MNIYSQTKEFRETLKGSPVNFLSKPGLPAWDQISPSVRLLAEHVTLGQSDLAILFGCGHGAAAVPLSKQLPQGEIWLTDPNIIALTCAQLTLEANQISNGKLSPAITLLPAMEATFNAVLIDLPKGRQLGRRWLLEGYRLLKPGGQLFLSGANDMGIQSLIRDGQELFGNAGILAYKKGSRLARFVRSTQTMSLLPDWTGEPGVAAGTWSSFPLDLDSGTYTIHSLPGVFSQHQLDKGTALLLQYAPEPGGPTVLDLGCGTGVIGMAAARRMVGKGQTPDIFMIDSNLMAVACAEKNIQANQITGAKAYGGDLIEGFHIRNFNQILTNPPFHAGKEVNYAVSEALIAQSYHALIQGGEFVLVANRFIPYDTLMKKLFSKVRQVFADPQYHILAATK